MFSALICFAMFAWVDEDVDIEAIRKLGGTISESVENEKKYFGVSLLLRKINDADLIHVARLRNVRTLDLGLTNITDTGLRGLKDLRAVESLSLWRTKVTDKGLQY